MIGRTLRILFPPLRRPGGPKRETVHGRLARLETALAEAAARQDAAAAALRDALTESDSGLRTRLERLLDQGEAAIGARQALSQGLDNAMGRLDRMADHLKGLEARLSHITDAISAQDRAATLEALRAPLNALLARDDAATLLLYGLSERLDRITGHVTDMETRLESVTAQDANALTLLYTLSEKLDLTIGHLTRLPALLGQAGSELLPDEIDRLDGYLCHHAAEIRTMIERLAQGLPRP